MNGWRRYRSRRRSCRQLLSVSAFKPIIDKILTEAGFATGPDALTSLTNALAAHNWPIRLSRPPPQMRTRGAPPDTISGTGKATLGPKS